MKGYSSREVISILWADDWYEVACVGDHHHFKHPEKKRSGYSSSSKQGFTDGNCKEHF